MNRIKYKIGVLKFVLLTLLPLGGLGGFTSCVRQVENAQKVDKLPSIFPDYIDVTIPVDIAPMDFSMSDEKVECIDVIAKGSKGGEIHSQGEFADFDIDEWHELTRQNEGGDIIFTVCTYEGGKWIQYKDFKMYVSKYHLDDYGLTYRLIPPGYEVGGNIGIYQRDIHTFDEYAIIEETAVPGQCMNCHTANKCSADEFLIHLRGDKGGTMVQMNGKQSWLNTKTDSTKANCGYSYWHPSGKYIASSINSIHQLFFTGYESRIEVFDTMSDVLVIDTRNNELILDERLQTEDYETYPVFSADGKTLYYCTAKYCELPTEYEKAKYSLCSIPFDEKTGKFGAKVDTLLKAPQPPKGASIRVADNRNSISDQAPARPLGGSGGSFTYPRPSYDGKWLMYCVADYSNFPVNHKESDLWIMDLKTGTNRPLKEVNSNDSESFHNWSTDSHWFVFSSRRRDSMYNLAYIASIDDEGKVTKPFLLPQKNPRKFYDESFDSFNCPDFTKDKVDFDVRQGGRECMSNDRVQVTVR